MGGNNICIEHERIKWHGSINTTVATFCLIPTAALHIRKSAEMSQTQPDD